MFCHYANPPPPCTLNNFRPPFYLVLPFPRLHSLSEVFTPWRQVVEKGEKVLRFREFVVFHSTQILPLYLIAYQRRP